jgi:hypothetical protein
MSMRAVIIAGLISIATAAFAAPENTSWPNYNEADFVITDYKFARGRHYRS